MIATARKAAVACTFCIALIAPAAKGDTRPELKAILDQHHRAMLRDDPIGASIRGEPGFGRLLPDSSPAAIAERRAAAALRLKRLKSINREGWSEEEQLNADLVITVIETATAGAKFFPEQYAVDDREGPAINIPQWPDRLPLRSRIELEDYVVRLEGVPTLLDQTIEQLKLGLAAKRLPPKIAVARTAAQSMVQATPEIVNDPTLSPFYRPFAILPPGDPLAERARTAIAKGIVPAFARMGTMLRETYIPACRDSVAASASVDGLAYYEHQLRRHTTTTMSAEEIHQLGLREVARLRAEMLTVIARTDFAQKDSLKNDALFAAFLNDLRTNPRFYFTKPEDLLNGYRIIAKRVDAELPKFFSVLPRNPYGIREIPRTAAESSPTAYYYEGSIKGGVAGHFMANTFKLDQRPKYEMIPLTLHEAMPGHHLQIALAQELQDVHPLRRLLDFTVFVEGWGLYSERLGLEMSPSKACTVDGGDKRVRDESRGFFADPYDDFGRLTYEMWRATRLVVDTGMHAKGWSRQQAIDYMLANTALSQYNIEREVDRYIAWPGQACAYKIGELKIRELRAKAEKALADKFDLRAFHDHLLGAGAIPLDVLEARMNRWIQARQKP